MTIRFMIYSTSSTSNEYCTSTSKVQYEYQYHDSIVRTKRDHELLYCTIRTDKRQKYPFLMTRNRSWMPYSKTKYTYILVVHCTVQHHYPTTTTTAVCSTTRKLELDIITHTNNGLQEQMNWMVPYNNNC
jgi:hypothetical protein